MFGLSTVAIRWIGGVVLVLLVLGGVYAKGRHDVQVKFDAYKAEVKAAAAAQERRGNAAEQPRCRRAPARPTGQAASRRRLPEEHQADRRQGEHHRARPVERACLDPDAQY